MSDLTDEQRARIPEFAQYGLDLITRTKPQTEEDRARFIAAVNATHAMSDLPPPRVVFTTSPTAARFATGFADILLSQAMPNVKPATCPGRLTNEVRRAALAAAGIEHTGDVKGEGPVREILGYGGLEDLAPLAAELGVGRRGLERAFEAHTIQEGGNIWAGPVARQEFFRKVLKLDVDWSVWLHWLAMAETGGFRYVHDDFVIVSDFPTEVHHDESDRPHNAKGPYMRWRDGFCVYAWHGIRVPSWIIEHPEQITPKTIQAETDAEIRRIQTEIYGIERYIADGGGNLRSEWIDEGGQPVRLYEVNGLHRLHVINSTADPDGKRRGYFFRVPLRFTTAHAARNWYCGLEPGETFDKVS